MLQKPQVRDHAVATPVRIVALDRARTLITLLVVLHHAVINYTWFGHGDRMRWLGFDLVVLFNDSFFMACMFFISGWHAGDRQIISAGAAGGWACHFWPRSSSSCRLPIIRVSFAIIRMQRTSIFLISGGTR